MKAIFQGKKWQVTSIALAIALAVSLSFNFYQALKGSRNSSDFSFTTNCPLTVEATNYPLKLSMTINQTEFKLKEPVKITLLLKNIGNQTITLVFSCGRDRFSFVVYCETGSTAFNSGEHTLYPQIWIPEEMSPDEEVLGSPNIWHQQVDPIRDFNFSKAKPGTYHIVGEFHSISLHLTIQTPPITIKIMR